MEKKKLYRLALVILFFGFADLAYAATLSVVPASGTFEVGDRVTARIVVSSGAPINAISGTISFPASLFSVESVSKTGSILNFWVTEPNFSKGTGTVQFEGVTLGGFQGGTGTVVLVTLKAVKPGSGEVSFTSGQVLANDGQGTDVTSGLSGATLSVVPKEEVQKPSEPEIIEEDLPQQPPSLSSPEIALTKKFGEHAVSGYSDYPRAQVLLTFVATNGTKVFITGDTDDNGEFVLLVPQTLKRGTYKVSAVVIKEDITHSYSSNEITIKIGNILSDVSIEIKISIIILIALLVYLIIRTYFYLKKNKKLRLFVKREAREAEDIVHKSFKVLNKEAGEMDTKEIKKDLREAEESIIKEIKDIEKT